MLVIRAGLLLLTVLCSTAATNVEDVAAAAAKDVQDKSSLTQPEDESPGADEAEAEGKFFLKSYSTATWTFLSSFTSTVPYTCFSSAAALTPCMGRRLRRSKRLRLAQDDDATAAAVETSLSSSKDELSRDTVEPDLGRRFFTIWRTSSTTVTITTFSTNRSVTVSASVACTFPGAVINAC